MCIRDSARDEQVGFAYKVSLRIEFLPYILISKFYQLEILDDIINILRKLKVYHFSSAGGLSIQPIR